MADITIGVIVKPHGVQGTLKIKSDSDFKTSRFYEGAVLTLGNHPTLKTATVTSFKEALPLDLLTLKEVTTRDQAETLRGVTLNIASSERQPLEEDAYYYNQLEGLEAFHEGTLIGTVIRVEDFPQGPMLRLSRPDEKTLLIPFSKAFVASVDLEKGTLTLIAWEGLW